MTDERRKIKELLEKHLISWFLPGDTVWRDTYKVTPDNLADFIDAHFVRRKKPKPFKEVLKDSML